MAYKRYPQRDAVKNYFPLPNEVFLIGLSPGELAIYSYLLYVENRSTFKSWPSYKTIGNAVDFSQNTVRKYVALLEERRLITTEHTTITKKDGTKRNGNLMYSIRPIQEALDYFNERQMAKLTADAARYKAQKRMEKYARCRPPEAPQSDFSDEVDTVQVSGENGEIRPLSKPVPGTKEEAG